jgi:tetratricopeptide (TPR) repeat protein
MYHAGQNIDIQLHEQLDYARVLYNKGFYQQSLKMLEKTKLTAQQAQLPHVALIAIDFEKLIESQYITRSLRGRAEDLSNEALDTVAHVTQLHQLSNVALRMYGLYLRVGHARSQEDHERISARFQASLAGIDVTHGGFFEKLYFYQAHMWFYTITQDFRACYRYGQKWVDLFEEAPEMKEQQPMLYIKGVHNLLASLYNLLYYSKFKQELEKFEAFAATLTRSTPNTEVLLFQYIYTHKINLCFLEGRFTEGLQLMPDLLEKLTFFQQHLDLHRRLIFYYKIASLYFGSGNYDKAITYLTRIIQYKEVSLREDIQCFARILNLIAHYEAGYDDMLDYQIKSVYRFLGKMNEQQQMQVEILRFLRGLGNVGPYQLKEAFTTLKDKLIAISDNPFERRPFLYLDIISWLESKIEGKSVEEIMRRKLLHMK